MFFDTLQLVTLRRDCEFNHIDYSRGRITPKDDGGFVVHLDAPLFDLGALLDPPPQLRQEAPTAIQAEGRMLSGLLAIQRAERQKSRLGRVVGWDTASIVRTALSDREISDYRANLEHQRRVAQLQKELAEALQAKARRESAKADAAVLKDRYGQANPVPAVEAAQEPEPAPAQAVPEVSVEALLQQSAAPYATRRTSRKGR